MQATALLSHAGPKRVDNQTVALNGFETALPSTACMIRLEHKAVDLIQAFLHHDNVYRPVPSTAKVQSHVPPYCSSISCAYSTGCTPCL
jgi:hypothetical protein